MFQKRLAIGIAVLVMLPAALFATDVARFANLGFSPDGETFMFGQFGIDGETGRAYADAALVDVADNVFVADGRSTVVAGTMPSAGQDGRGALYRALFDLHDTIATSQIDHVAQGRIIYLLINGTEPRDEISFRDFETGIRYDVSLTQRSRGAGDDVAAAFGITLRTHHDEAPSRSYAIGRPTLFRDGVSRYRIAQIILSPGERGAVFVVEQIRELEDGTRIRYMVETVAF